MESRFGELVKDIEVYTTPGAPGLGSVESLKYQASKLNADDYEAYRSGVGMLVYFVKQLRPDTANAVRELPKALSAST